MTAPATDSLVLYKGRPARVVGITDKLELELEDGRSQRVRPKDVSVLHPGPVKGLAGLEGHSGEVLEAWELLQGGETALPELAELAFGDYTPQTAWAAWELVAEGLYFTGSPEAITVRPAEEVERLRSERETREAERTARAAFLTRLKAGRVADEDAPFLQDVIQLAEGRGTRSRLMVELGQEETPEAAHAMLLRLGLWDETVNPYPRRHGQPLDCARGDVPPLPDEDRVDLTHLPAFAIDDDDNRDPDDAVSLEPGRLWVHVADVAALVPPDCALDLEARGRGANLYLPDRTVSMLPDAVTERLGLGLAEVSPALSFGIQLDADGTVTGLEVVRSWVRVTRLSYGRVEGLLDHEPPFPELARLTAAARARREARGAAFIELPEVKVRVVDGEVRIIPLPRLRSRDLVTEAMVMAGESVARLAFTEGLPVPFATQPEPDASGRPRGYAEMYARRKLMRRSQMSTAPGTHAGLGLELYCQSTSPLRRYLDLVVHQQLRAWLNGAQPLSYEDLMERIGATDAVTGPVRQAERASNRHWTLVHLRRSPGWTGEGIVVERRNGRAVVLVPELGLEANVKLADEVALDAPVRLRLTGVDLPSLSAYFRATPGDG